MDEKAQDLTKAYSNENFLNSSAARSLRILAEYLEPHSRLSHYGIEDTIVFMGSARCPPPGKAKKEVKAAKDGDGDLEKAKHRLEMSKYYESAKALAHRLTDWSKKLPDEHRRFVVCTGGGPGIMEAASRGASEAKGMNTGLTISIPEKEFANRYVTRELGFHFVDVKCCHGYLLHELLGALWVAALALPVGFLARRWVPSVFALALLAAALEVVPQRVGLLATPPAQLLGAALGVGAGVGLRWILSRGEPT